MPPADLDGPVWYFAFGSNMNERLFRERRHMTPIETRIARLDGYRLRFAVAGRRSSGASARFVELIQGIDQVAAGGRQPGVSAPADIVEAPGDHVWGVLYLLPFRNFVRLDASEGRQYAYLWVDVEDQDGRTVHALTYRVPYPAPEGRPSRGYLELIRTAARERGMPESYVAFLNRVEPRP
jgi:cation transport regulator ChaC